MTLASSGSRFRKAGARPLFVSSMLTGIAIKGLTVKAMVHLSARRRPLPRPPSVEGGMRRAWWNCARPIKLHSEDSSPHEQRSGTERGAGVAYFLDCPVVAIEWAWQVRRTRYSLLLSTAVWRVDEMFGPPLIESQSSAYGGFRPKADMSLTRKTRDCRVPQDSIRVCKSRSGPSDIDQSLKPYAQRQLGLRAGVESTTMALSPSRN